MIFNLDRFIVSSTGKGDGTEKITFQELVSALPRIVMGTIIGISLSAPLEIRVLKAEIDAELAHEVNAERDRFNAEEKARYDSERAKRTEAIAALEKKRAEKAEYLEKRRLELSSQRRNLELEAEGKTLNGMPGHGPAYQDKADNLAVMDAAYKEEQQGAVTSYAEWDGEIKSLKEELAATEREQDERYKENSKRAQRVDGLMKRIEIAERLGKKGVDVPDFLRLLLLAIELSPIFFKMMMTKGVYDALVENQNLIIKAQHGIEGDATLLRDAQNREQYRDIYHHANSLLDEERRRAETERTLAKKAHEEFVEGKLKEIAADPSKFVTTDKA
jgi:hypothetical protein